MFRYVRRRLGYAALTFVGITIATFMLIHAVPGDPVDFMFRNSGGARVDPRVIAAVRADFHLDEPLYIQYTYWFGSLISGELGTSFVDRRPVTDKIAEKLPASVLLNSTALLLALLIAIPSGVFSASRRHSLLDRGSRSVFFVLYSLPAFWFALLLVHLFAVRLPLFPLMGMQSDDYLQLGTIERLLDRAAHLVLPVTALASSQIAVFARFSRAAMLEVLPAQYMTAARARGLSERSVVWKHGFRNAALPLITLLGLTLPYLISGSVVIERIFQWDGVGKLFLEAALARDYPVVMGLTAATALVTLLVSVIADLMYGFADPRIDVDSHD